MAERGSLKAPLVLTEEERQTLERWARRRTWAQALALPAWVVLACAQGAINVAVAQQLPADPQLIDKARDIVGRTWTSARRAHDDVRHGTASLFAALAWRPARSSPQCSAATRSSCDS
jgi:hypothetical protein